MTFWSLNSAPLYVGGDIYFLDDKAVSILSNPEVIAVDQSGLDAVQVTGGATQVWKQQGMYGRQVAAVFNLGSTPADITVKWSDLGLSSGWHPVRDLVARGNLGWFGGSWTASAVPPHGSRLIAIG